MLAIARACNLAEIDLLVAFASPSFPNDFPEIVAVIPSFLLVSGLSTKWAIAFCASEILFTVLLAVAA